MTATRIGTGTAGRGPVITAVGGLVLAVAAIALIGGWRVNRQERMADVAVPAAVATTGDVPRPDAVQPALTVVVVGSSDAAAFTRTMLSTAEAGRVTPPPNVFVLDGSTAGADAIIEAFWADARMAFPDGGPTVQVVDLRVR